MSYLAFYRKYRPTDFEELIGQDVIKKILINSISNSSVAHAYLFNGPRGTGKTTTAKIFSKAIISACPKIFLLFFLLLKAFAIILFLYIIIADTGTSSLLYALLHNLISSLIIFSFIFSSKIKAHTNVEY